MAEYRDRLAGNETLGSMLRHFLLEEIDGRITIACALLCLLAGIFFEPMVAAWQGAAPGFPRGVFFLMPVLLFLFWIGARMTPDRIFGRPLSVAVRSVFPIALTGYLFGRFLGFL